MDTKHCLLGMELGARQSFENMAVFPLRLAGKGADGRDELSVTTSCKGMLGPDKEGARKESKGKGGKSSRKRGGKAGEAGQTGGETAEQAKAREFLGKAAECREARYQSVGLGDSLRYEGRGVIGSALALDEAVIHMAFFGTDAGEPGRKAEDMAALGARRRYRL